MMSKLEYLRVMESILKVRLTQKEVDEIMRDYAEYFVEGARQGKSDYEIAYNLGDPREVANQIISETLSSRPAGYGDSSSSGPSPWEKAEQAAKSAAQRVNRSGNFFLKALAVCVGLLLLPFAAAALLMVLGLVAGAVAGLFGWVAGMGACILAGVISLVVSFLFLGALPWTAIAGMIVISVGIISGGILGVCLGLMLIRCIWRGLVWAWWRLYSAVTKKPIPQRRGKTEDTVQPENPRVENTASVGPEPVNKAETPAPAEERPPFQVNIPPEEASGMLVPYEQESADEQAGEEEHHA